MSEHLWRERAAVRVHRLYAVLKKRSLVYCIRCGVSQGAAERFGWMDCAPIDESRYVWLRNPRTGAFKVVDRETGTIVDHGDEEESDA